MTPLNGVMSYDLELLGKVSRGLSVTAELFLNTEFHMAGSTARWLSGRASDLRSIVVAGSRPGRDAAA